jgi:hypothetical protein
VRRSRRRRMDRCVKRRQIGCWKKCEKTEEDRQICVEKADRLLEER